MAGSGVLPQAVTEYAQAAPDKVAIESADSGAQVTWREFDGGCRLWADAFRRLGIGVGETVLTMMPNSIEAFFAWLGCGWLRAVEVPVNAEYRGAWLENAIETSQARAIVISREFVPQLAAVRSHLEKLHSRLHTVVVHDACAGEGFPGLASFRVLTGEKFLEEGEPATDLEDPQPWDLACIMFTSGTTGPSKGVMMPWGQVNALVTAAWPKRLFDGVVYYSPWLPHHMLGKGSLCIVTECDGRLVVRSRFSVAEFWGDVRRHGCTATVMVGPVVNFLRAQPPRADDADNPLESVLMVPAIPEADEFKARFGVTAYTNYGSTELNTPIVSHMREVDSSNWRSCGRVREGADVAVVDEHDYPVGPNTAGELVVRPTEPWTLNLGYFGMPEATVTAWRNGWFHSGDTFVYDEHGDYYFIDRVKDYIRRRGENISSLELEATVGQLRGVAECAAVAVHSAEGEEEVKVVVVLEEGAILDPPGIIESIIPVMPRFAVPRYVEIVAELPKTLATLRVQKVKLREAGVTDQTWDRLASGIEFSIDVGRRGDSIPRTGSTTTSDQQRKQRR